MTAKEYLRQAYRLDQKISSDLEEVASLREMSASVSSPQLTERVKPLKTQMRLLYGPWKKSWIWRSA